MTNKSLDNPPDSPPEMDDAADKRDKRDELDEGTSFPIVGIGASAGGLEAFTQLLKALPLDTGMGFVLVQHLDPEHESALKQILTRATSLPVHEVTNNQVVQANHVYIIPPDTNLSIAEGVLKLEPRLKVRTPHRPIDTFFESLSHDLRERAIGVVLSGTASDGTLGLEAIKAEGGITFAQDDSAKYDSMPRSAVGAGCVDLVLSPADIAKELARIAQHPYVAGQPFDLATRPESDRAEATKHEGDDKPLPSGGSGTPATQSRQVHSEADGEEAAARGTSAALDGYRKIVLLLRSHSGVDFSHYKSNTIQRRITRRLVLSNLETLDDYADFLRGNAKELNALYSDVLISVTSFFRNPEMFDVLQREVFPKLLKQPGDQPIRVWVLGCSKGQEAYSIAMAYLESAEKSSRLRKLQVFATDLNDTLLDKARNGLYAKSLADDITPERLRRFFNEEQGGYRVCKMLREMVVFARQNLIADTPFSRMDLVSCRNLLIYLEPSLQKKAMPTFHFALKPGGFLLLGASESIGGFTDLFEPVDKKYKIYSKKPAQPLGIQLPVRGVRDEYGAASERPLHQSRMSEPPEGFRGEHNNILREADRIALSQYAPPGVVVNAELQILQFRGPTGAFLEPPIGKASFDVLKMAREGLMLPLRSAINEAIKENKSVRRESVHVKQDGKTRTISLEIIPLKNQSENGFLILFDDAEKVRRVTLATQAGRSDLAPELIDDAAETGVVRPSAYQKTETHDVAASRIADLETELSETREYLQSIQEQHEAATEELQAASEEVQSSNEELQSINEELETSKEEMESANEELTTVNEEMSNRNVELDRVNNDLVNLQTSAKLAIVLLGRDLTIRRFSPQAEKQFDLLAADVGRPISHIRHNLFSADAVKSPVDLRALAAVVIADVREQECEVRDNADRWHLLRVRPYMTLDNKVDGAVLVLVEIEALKRSEQIATAAYIYAENTLDTVREPMLVLDHDLRVESANRSFYRTFRVAPAETVGMFVYELGNRQWNIPRLRELLHETLSVNQSVEDFEVKHHFEQLGCRSMLLNARRIIDPLQNSERILLAIEDITDRKRTETVLKVSEIRYRRLFESAKDGILILDAHAATITDANPFMTEMLGYSHDEFVGKELWQIGLFKDAEASKAAMRELQEKGYIQYEDLPLETKAGRPINVEFVSNVYAENGETVIQCNVRDITKRRVTERALEKALVYGNDIIATLREPFVVLDADLRVRTANRSFYDSFHVSKGETENQFVYDLGNGQWDIPALRTLLDQVLSRNESVHDFEVEHTFPALGRKTMLLNARPFPPDSKHPELILLAVEDVSAVRERADDLAAANRRKDEFLATLAHELRNPLAPIRNGLQLMKLAGGNPDLVENSLRIMERQVSQMTHLIDDLMDLSRISGGKIVLQKARLKLVDVIQDAVDTSRPLIEERGHDLVVDVPPEQLYVNADRTRLAQVFGNLLNNAAKYTDTGGRIRVAVERQDGDVVVTVEDNGVGIAAHLLTHVFDMFSQVDRSLEKSQGGLGIGLNIVKRLAEMHDGSIVAESDGHGAGSRFVVRLPIALPLNVEQRDERVESVVESVTVTAGRRILVVDDNRDAAICLTMILKVMGYELQTAHDGFEAFDLAAAFRPDLVLLDIGMPKLNGYDTARRIREQAWGKSMVLVALTGWGQDEDKQKSQEAGFDAHLVKPVDLAALDKLLGGLKTSTV